MMKKLIVFLLLITLVNQALAQDSPFGFLRIAYGGRTAALGGSTEALNGTPDMLFTNPASIFTCDSNSIHITFIKHVIDINSGVGAYILPIDEKYGKFAISTGFTSYGSFNYADNSGNLSGNTFTANDFSLGFTYANNFEENFTYGITSKFIYTGIEEMSTSALLFDAGLQYSFADERTNIGLSILHAGFQLTKLNDVDDDIPLDVRIGVNHRLKGLPLLLNIGFHHLADSTDSFSDKLKFFSIGGEFSFGQYLKIRLGYDNQIRSLTKNESDKGLNGLSAGIGLKTQRISFDYGVNQYGAGAMLHRLSLNLSVF